jgi:transmembrane sensor
MNQNNDERFQYLLEQYSKNQSSAEELEELFKMMGAGSDSKLSAYFDREWQIADEQKDLPERELDHIYRAVIQTASPTNNKPVKLFRVLVAAALLLIIAATASLLIKPLADSERFANDVLPGRDRAVLTLNDGTRIDLDQRKTGKLAGQGTVSITKGANGLLTYHFSGPGESRPDNTGLMNEISTPNGGQYQLVLSDGTKVWLNATSSLRFPVAFAAGERKITLSGEAYFEVAHDAKRPFIITTAREQVKVLGTHFNMNSYRNEPASITTLVEGRVEVSSTDKNMASTAHVLEPGQEATTSSQGIVVHRADLEKAMAWKNGYFIFHNENLETIMRDIERWYDVTVVYEGDFSDKRFEGSVSRFKNVSEILRKFELTNSIHFKIEGRRITVTD